MASLLEVRHLTVEYGGSVALRDLCLVVPSGRVVALLGANGAGKTTTLRVISGLVRPRSGEIWYDGRRINGVPPHRIAAMGVGHVPEGRRVFAGLTVTDNLEVGGWRHRGAAREDLDRVHALFPVLADKADDLAGTLSGGQQQLLAIGRALMGRPRLLLLDEPSLGLAPTAVDAVFAALTTLAASGTTLLLVEQDVERALSLASEGHVLETGERVAGGPAAQLRADPRLASAYLGGELT